ncbi:hypothetical protein [Streptomyces sp. NRRL S-87]|uniref:hypothetical protein n=1 Tax=Streptomyces sp. NRRL S-87 TaxID=1463920 RepID=UPI00068A86F3|nr:hypothetical protein [Streptomyces sp. NRRL S-87]
MSEQHHGHPDTGQPAPEPYAGGPQDPFSTQTWSSETWDTTYQPVFRPEGAPGGHAADPAAYPDAGRGAVPQQHDPHTPHDPLTPHDPHAQQSGPWPQPADPQAPQAPSWARHTPAPGTAAAPAAWPEAGTGAGAPGPGPSTWTDAGTGPAAAPPTAAPWPEAGTGQVAPAPAATPWPEAGTGQVAPAPAATPWPEAGTGQVASAPVATPWPEAGTGHTPAGAPWPEAGTGQVAPAPTAAPWPDAGTGQAPVAAAGDAAETAYLPPVRDDAPFGAADAAATAYLPPVREDGPAPYAVDAADAVAETAYLPPVRDEEAPRGRHGARPQQPAPVGTDPDPAAPGAGGAPQPGPPGGAETGEYSAPVTLGSVRVRDPRQARAEGRSPIIDPGPQSALITAALGGLMAVAAGLGQYALLLPLVALQGLTAAGWFRLNGMWPARQGIALAFLGGLVADGAVLATGRGPAAVLGTLGVWVLLTLVLQLRSHADPDERMYGLMASVASAALAVVCAGYLAADHGAVTVGAAAVAVAAVVRALPLPAAPSVGVSLAAAAGVGLLVGGFAGTGAGGALIGLAAGACALAGLRVAAYDYPSKFVHMTAGVALPLALAAPAVHLVGRVVAG